jgi:hypothetical protein
VLDQAIDAVRGVDRDLELLLEAQIASLALWGASGP